MALARRGVAVDTESVSTRAIGGFMWKSRSVMVFVALLAGLLVLAICARIEPDRNQTLVLYVLRFLRKSPVWRWEWAKSLAHRPNRESVRTGTTWSACLDGHLGRSSCGAALNLRPVAVALPSNTKHENYCNEQTSQFRPVLRGGNGLCFRTRGCSLDVCELRRERRG